MRGKAHGHAEPAGPARHALALRNTMAAQVVAPTAEDDAWYVKAHWAMGPVPQWIVPGCAEQRPTTLLIACSSVAPASGIVSSEATGALHE